MANSAVEIAVSLEKQAERIGEIREDHRIRLDQPTLERLRRARDVLSRVIEQDRAR
jgi:hypothetical protein